MRIQTIVTAMVAMQSTGEAVAAERTTGILPVARVVHLFTVEPVELVAAQTQEVASKTVA